MFTALMGLFYFIMGLITKKWPPQWPNIYYGYRTKRSCATKEAWDYANDRCTYLFLLHGIVITIMGMILWLIGIDQITDIIFMSIICTISPLYVIWKIEKELKSMD